MSVVLYYPIVHFLYSGDNNLGGLQLEPLTLGMVTLSSKDLPNKKVQGLPDQHALF